MSVMNRNKDNLAQALGLDPSELLNTTELAELLGVSYYTIRNWKRAGHVKAYGIGRVRYYSKSEALKAYTEHRQRRA